MFNSPRAKAILTNQSGSISILIALGVVSVGALLVFQLSSSFQTVNRLQTAQKSRGNIDVAMQRLGLTIKHGYDLAQTYGDCNKVGIGKKEMKTIKVNNLKICIANKKSLCVEHGEQSDTPDNLCLSLAPEMLDWTGGSQSSGVASRQSDSIKKSENRGGKKSDLPDPLVSRNKIEIPPALNKSCDKPGDRCIRLVLCSGGETTCSLADAKATQIVRLGGS